jgi:secreted PhoX family phosphatase
MDRRSFLTVTGVTSQYLLTGAFLSACGGGSSRSTTPTRIPQTSLQSNLTTLGPLQAADANGILLPAGFSSRVVATSSELTNAGSGYPWHAAPDGGAVFEIDDGWIYVSNSEIGGDQGGAGALRFDAAGRLVDAYPILSGTNRNCAGGATTWNTWLSCEEINDGLVWECDPTGANQAMARPALGRFRHEAVAEDPTTRQLYLTEDQPDGRWYRFTPDSVDANGRADLTTGMLEVAQDNGGQVTWLPLIDPSGSVTTTRHQLLQSTAFNGGEGISYSNGTIYFTTKGDNRVWAYQISAATLSIVYDAATAANPILTGVDNIEATQFGDLIVAEDGGDMEIVVVSSTGETVPLLQIEGHDASEITGPAFTADFSRLYFSSQRGATGDSNDGVTYEVSGPFTSTR